MVLVSMVFLKTPLTRHRKPDVRRILSRLEEITKRFVRCLYIRSNRKFVAGIVSHYWSHFRCVFIAVVGRRPANKIELPVSIIRPPIDQVQKGFSVTTVLLPECIQVRAERFNAILLSNHFVSDAIQSSSHFQLFSEYAFSSRDLNYSLRDEHIILQMKC